MCKHDDVTLSVNMVEMGVRSSDWFDKNKSLTFDDIINQQFQQEKTLDFTACSAFTQSIHSSNKPTLSSDDCLSTDTDANDNDNDYDIDPETGTS
jgi:hypothetical protein